MRKFVVTLNEHQLRLISQCVEDLHRFYGGQMELWNTAPMLDHENFMKLRDKLNELKPLVTPHLERNASYGWDGSTCPNKHQRKFLAETYYIYREILHKLTDPKDTWNVYSGFTLRCEESGEPIKIEELKQ
jgi:hypothetical protein